MRLSPILSQAFSPHKSLTLLPSFLSPSTQSLLLSASLRLLSLPSRTTSQARRRARVWTKQNPTWREEDGFIADDAYVFEERHYDGVIEGYREMLVRDGLWGEDERLAEVLQSLYALLPPPSPLPPPFPSSSTPAPPSTSASPSHAFSAADPPSHLLLHLLHLSSNGAIYPHVDNLEASGGTIVGLSLGGERVLRFKRSRGEAEEAEREQLDGPDEFEVLLEPGSVYIQRDPLRTHYTHEVPARAQWEGREVGGTQRLSLVLRDKLQQTVGRKEG